MSEIENPIAFDGDLWTAINKGNSGIFNQLIEPYFLEREGDTAIIAFPFCGCCFFSASLDTMTWFIEACKQKFQASKIILRATDKHHTKRLETFPSLSEAERFMKSNHGHCSLGGGDLLCISVVGMDMIWQF